MAMSEKSFDTDLFIMEIEQRPALWNSGLNEYSDKNIRKKLWEEIVQRFGGEEQDVLEKKQLGVQLQKKWKNLRDSYFRELRRLKNIRIGAAAPKKNSYIYFQQLHFLKVVAETSDTPSSQTYRPPPKKTSTEDYVGLEMVIHTATGYKPICIESEHHDSDKLFLLSLLDDFKKIPDYSKSTAKIELIKLIQSYRP
ncbi:uncharacterized protein LOC110835438 [Zootermopsis nevadensis]|uniref:uncharacterized protein LOC110835438 n=1 Tax=Zootermopsis nevadensis TaxID=136037 RepID=UPI000B8E4B64|nr:uncharacterized protein LOC110835438 [Zootermopsis nevadensis]